MNESIYKRKFKLWFYQVSHSEAIIRSPKVDFGKTYEKNIDIYLGDIDYIEMPTMMRDLQIGDATKEELSYLAEKLGKDISSKKMIVLISEGRRYYVVAGIIKIMENDLDFGVLPIAALLCTKE